jgi:putative selenium metabolism protein SsnA
MSVRATEVYRMLLVGNGRVITRDPGRPYLENGAVAIDGERIVEVGESVELREKFPAAQFVDARRRVMMPGLINAHMHLYSTFARGMALKDDAPGNFLQILERLWWRLDRVLTAEDNYYSALVPLIDCIKNGTTTIFDHHSSPSAVRGSLFRLAGAAQEAGVRACLCYEVSDRDGAKVADEAIAENRDFLADCQRSGDLMAKGMFGLHASFTLSDDTIKRCVNAGEGLNAGFHIHTAEAPEDLAHCRRVHGRGVVERLAGLGILGERSIAAHCVHISEREIDLLQANRTNAVHNPESNMGNAVGCAPVLDMMRRGVRVGLGTDGYTCDMFESLKAANLLHKHQSGNPGAAWSEPPKMLFEQNSALASEYFGGQVGILVAGAYADLILVDYDPPTPLCAQNINSHILFGMTGRAVDTTIINGKVVMADRKLLNLDEERIMGRARELAAKLWERF